MMHRFGVIRLTRRCFIIASCNYRALGMISAYRAVSQSVVMMVAGKKRLIIYSGSRYIVRRIRNKGPSLVKLISFLYSFEIGLEVFSAISTRLEGWTTFFFL